MIIAKRTQVASGTATITEAYTAMVTVRAGILPLGPMTFLQGEQTDRPVTHKVIVRWLDWLDQTHIIVRRTMRRNGHLREEIFRIVKVAEDQGQKRFLELLVQLEHRA